MKNETAKIMNWKQSRVSNLRDDRGIALLGMLVCAGALAGSHRGAWWTLWGALIMLGIYGPIYLVGAYERAKDFHSDNNKSNSRGKRQMIMETKNDKNKPEHDERGAASGLSASLGSARMQDTDVSRNCGFLQARLTNQNGGGQQSTKEE